jgi:MinD-like ATPase involved in chromosome partitioning or flagellar assembly
LGRERDVPTPELVINLADGIVQAELVAKKLRAVCERFLSRSPRLAGWMPRSRAVAASVSSRRPFAISAPRSLESACLRRLGERLSRLLPEAAHAAAQLKG